VCQDFTHLMLGALRLMGIPCRYVSGYLHVATKRAEPAQSHAWIEFWSPASGWVPHDPTHDREIDERYVVVGHGRSYDDVPPNKGIYRGNASETLQAEVRTALATKRTSLAPQESVEVIEIPSSRRSRRAARSTTRRSCWSRRPSNSSSEPPAPRCADRSGLEQWVADAPHGAA
jgi:transglutaminase-like putative cysteine protease